MIKVLKIPLYLNWTFYKCPTRFSLTQSHLGHGCASQRHLPDLFHKLFLRSRPRYIRAMWRHVACQARDADWFPHIDSGRKTLTASWPMFGSSSRTLRVVVGESYPNLLTLNMIIKTLGSPPLNLYSKQHTETRKTY